jgi:hypothetical protein
MATTTNFGWETPDDTDLVKDGALAMRTLGNAIDTSLVDLKGGTTGQVLSKTTNTDMDFTWTTPSATTPSFVGASVYGTTDQTINNATNTALTWSDELFDTNGFHSTSVDTSRMTIPTGKAGKYLIAGTTTWGPDRTGRCQQIIYKNGSIFAYVIAGPMSQSPGQNYTLIMDLAVGDYVEVFARQDTGSAADVTKSSLASRFQIEYLGA